MVCAQDLAATGVSDVFRSGLLLLSSGSANLGTVNKPIDL
jgi:hypothetical protein